jgi:nucleotide-binding universal stress UspA family protein
MSIVVGYIDSPEGNAAMKAAIAEARVRDVRIVVVHSFRGGDHTSADDIFAYRKRLEVITEHLEQQGIDFEIHEYVRDLSPAEDIADAAKQFDADLIVIGLRVRTATGKYLLGSNAREILMTAPCPVLTIKAEYEG